MSKIISLSVNVDKINKAKLYKGEKGTYLNLTVSINDEADQYGNHCSTWENQTKEEREAKKEKNYLGNGKVVWSSDTSQTSANMQPKQDNPVNEVDSLPF